MHTYNKIMTYFWLVMGTSMTLYITYMGFQEGFKKWAFYYFFALSAFVAFFFKKWMIKRMEKHNAFLESQRKNQNN